MISHKIVLLCGRTIATGLLHMLATAVVARQMGAEALGTIGYLMGLVGVLSLVSDLGYSHAYIQRISSRQDFARHSGTFALVKVVLALVLSVLILIVPSVGQHIGRPFLRGSVDLVPYYFVGVFYVTSLLSTIFLRTFGARLQAAKLTVVGLGSTLLYVLAQLLAAWQGWGVVGLSVAVALKGVGLFILGLYLFREYRVGRPSVALFRDYTVYAWPLMALIIITSLTGHLDRVLLGSLGGAVQVGYYVGVFGVLALTTEMVRAAMVLFFPRVSQDAALDDFDRMHNRLKGALKYLLLLVVPSVALLIMLREPLVRLYLGAAFLPAAPIAAVFALCVVPTTVSRPYHQILFAVARHRYLLTARLLGLSVLLVACGVLIPSSLFGWPTAGLGALGAAVAVLLKETLECVYVIHFSTRHAGIGLWQGTYWFLLAGSLMVGVGTAALLPFPQPGFVLQLLAPVLGLAVYLLLLYASGQLRPADLSVLRDAMHPGNLLRYMHAELNTVGQETASGPESIMEE